MNEKTIVNPNARGFAGLLKNIMEPLNSNPDFEQKFKKINKKFLINAPNLHYAAILSVNGGSLKVESVPNKPESNLSKKKIHWNGFISMDSQIFLALAMNRISMMGIIVKWISKKVTMKGIVNLLTLLKIFNFLK
jgi:hypothetical protein